MKVIRSDGKQAYSIDDAKVLLSIAQSEFEVAEGDYRQASRVRTAALNKLNDAQKAFDAAVDDLRGFAPAGSDWKTKAALDQHTAFGG